MGLQNSVHLSAVHEKNKIKVIQLKTLNQLVVNYCSTNINEKKYEILECWNTMLEEKPLYSNYTYDVDTSDLYRLNKNNIFKPSRTSLKAHININGLTPNCLIVLNDRQLRIYELVLSLRF